MKENRLVPNCALRYTPNYEESGARMKQRRRDMGIRVDELADAFNVTTKTIYRWEAGKCFPSIDNLFSLAVVLDTTLDDLVVGNRGLVLSNADRIARRSVAAGSQSHDGDDSRGRSGSSLRQRCIFILFCFVKHPLAVAGGAFLRL